MILIGPPGVGKSSYLVGKYDDHVVCSSDNIFVRKGLEFGLTYDEAFRKFSFKEIESAFKNDIRRAVNEGKNIVIDRTNLSKKSRSKLFNYIDESYEKVGILFEFINHRAELAERLLKRKIEEGKTISEKVMEEMFKKYEEPTLEEFDKLITVNTFIK